MKDGQRQSSQEFNSKRCVHAAFVITLFISIVEELRTLSRMHSVMSEALTRRDHSSAGICFFKGHLMSIQNIPSSHHIATTELRTV